MKSSVLTPLRGAVALLFLVTVLLSGTAFGAASVYPTGLTIINESLVHPGKVVYSPGDGKAYLVSTRGNTIHTWESPVADVGITHARPLDNGNILTRLRGDDGSSIAELNAFGDIVWEFPDFQGTGFHHDHSRLENGNTLIMCARNIDVPSISPITLEDDCILEVEPDGTVVFDWQTADHFDDFNFPQAIKDKIAANGGDWAHANAVSAISSNTSHVDPRFRPGNLIISYRFIETVAIVDKDTGDIVWVSEYGKTIGQHDSHMLTDDQTGSGNILIFDNGFGGKFGLPSLRAFSRVIELDPTDGSVDWEYTASKSGVPSATFDSWFISSAARLPNGNTFIDEGAFGRFFEVTPTGEIVWEYINPIFALGGGNTLSNAVYRAYKVAQSWRPNRNN